MESEPNEGLSRRMRAAMAAAIVLSFGVAATVFILRIVLSDLPIRYEFAGSFSLAVVTAVPPTLALLALRGRTALFLPAALVALLHSPIVSIFGLVLIFSAFVWYFAYLRIGGHSGFVRTASAFAVVVLLWFGAAASLFVHIDPLCVDWLSDGTYRTVDAESQGLHSGWVWDMPATETGSSIIAGDVERGVCTSDILTPLEGIIAVVLASAALGAGVALISPREESLIETSG